MIHMKNQGFFSSKDKSKKLKCSLLQYLYGALGLRRGNKEEHNKTIRRRGLGGGIMWISLLMLDVLSLLRSPETGEDK